MLKASALYIVIVIALVIGLICSSLIVVAYYYKAEYQKKFRYSRLESNLQSGINILLAGQDTSFIKENTFSLFGGDADSIFLKKINWGVYDIGVVKAIIQRDTLYKTFSIASTIDSTKWAAIYLVDEDRPFSLSGKTSIIGDVYIPKAGVQEAYIDNKAYTGDKRLIIGKKHTSAQTLPILNNDRLISMQRSFNKDSTLMRTLPKIDSLQQSFLLTTQIFNFKKEIQTLSNIRLKGNIILRSDTSIIIDSTAELHDILIFAKSITVKSGFHGNCQLFAVDSISVERHCHFNYPSCLGILRYQSTALNTQEKITIGSGNYFSGTIFNYEKAQNQLKPSISIGKHTQITGQVYSQGILELKDSTEVHGSAFTSLFYYRNAFTLFENYLINTTIDSKALSPYYLSGDLMPTAGKKKKVLQWMEANY
jgi:hypothetical protein